MPRSPAERLYLRGARWWIDLRDLNGRQEPLRAPGAKQGTEDRETAERLALARVQQLREMPRRTEAPTGLEGYAGHYLLAKARAGSVTTRHLADLESRLKKACAHFGKTRPLETIRPSDVREWLAQLPSTNGATRRQYLNALSNLYRYAQSDEVVPPGFNPASAIVDKPRGERREARWLEPHEAALLLEAARRFEVPPGNGPDATMVYPLVATLLLTGGRPGEVLGLAADDVSFDRGTVTFRPHPWRRLKNVGSGRVVPLWPQLREILGQYLLSRPPRQLLFPSTRKGEDVPLRHWRKSFARLRSSLGWTAAELECAYALRHTYCAARLQTLDQGAPVSAFTVGRELGHGSATMVQQVYGHLGEVRQRSEVVEFRIEQHVGRLKDQLERLGWREYLSARDAVTAVVTANA